LVGFNEGWTLLLGIVIDVVVSRPDPHVQVYSSVVEGGCDQGSKIWFVFFGDGGKLGLFTLQFHSWWLRAEIGIGHGFFFF
jgi:hypothetical protein